MPVGPRPNCRRLGAPIGVRAWEIAAAPTRINPHIRVLREIVPPTLLEPGVAPSRVLRFERGNLRQVGPVSHFLLVVSVNRRKEELPAIPKSLDSLECKGRLGNAPRVVLFRASLMAGG